MGQSSPAIMLGLKTYPAGVGDEDEGLIADFAETVRVRLGARSTWDGRVRALVPRSPSEADLPAIGLFVAIGGSGDDDDAIPYLEPFALADIESAFGGHTVRVRQAWADFAAFCEARGVTLPAPELFFTTTETA